MSLHRCGLFAVGLRTDRGGLAVADCAWKWINHGFGQIAAVVSSGAERGHVYGRDANEVFARTRTSCGRGRGPNTVAASWRTLRDVSQPLHEHCVGKLRTIHWTLCGLPTGR